jgi:hypothetical protein
MSSRVKRLKAWRQASILAAIAWGCSATLAGCGEPSRLASGGGDAKELIEIQKKVAPDLFKKKTPRGWGYEDVDLRERRQILREERQKQQESR